MTFELARPGDGAAILRIFKATFDLELLPMIPLGMSGAERYLEETIAKTSGTIWFVARNSSVCGFAGYRQGPSGFFLNYLHVDPSTHGKRIGTHLFLNSVVAVVAEKDQQIGLDVDQKNLRAKAWYERLGFKAQQTSHWQIFPLAFQSNSNFKLLGIAEADDMHRKFGFSAFNIETDGNSFQVGRLGSRYFRATDPKILEYRAVLHAIDSNRELLLISSETHESGREVSRRDRMSAPVQTVIKNLRKE